MTFRILKKISERIDATNAYYIIWEEYDSSCTILNTREAINMIDSLRERFPEYIWILCIDAES